MKKLLLIAFFSLSIGICKAEDYSIQLVGPFGTLNNIDSPISIGSDKAQDLLNVDLTPGGKSVRKRKGFSTTFSLSVASSAVHGIYNFYDGSGNDVSLFFNDTRMSSSISGRAPTVLFSTGSLGATYQCTDSLGFAYCLNTGRTSLIKTDGATVSLITSVNSTGTIVAVTPDRLVNAGFSDAPSRIDFSKSVDFTTWRVGGLDTDPLQFTITAPGSRITMLCYAFNRLMWFKDSSFGYILDGPTQLDWTVKTISPNIGTLDNSYIYWQGILYFRGQDAHIYMYDGSTLTKMTRDIQTTISQSQVRRSNSWTQTLNTDWGAGSFDNIVYADTSTAPGTLQTTFPDGFETFRDGSNGKKDVWVVNSSVTSNGSVLSIVGSGTSAANFTRMNYATNDLRVGTTIHFKVSSLDYSPTMALPDFRFVLSTATTVTPVQSQFVGSYFGQNYAYMQFTPITTSTVQFFAGGDLCGNSISFSTSIATPFTVDVFIATNTNNFTINGTSSVVRACSNPASARYYRAYLQEPYALSTGTVRIDDFSIAPETFTYLSPVNNANSLTSWDAFTANYQDNGGNNYFAIRSSNTIFTQNQASPPPYSSITSGNTPTISTGSYFQIKDYIVTSTWTSTPKLQDFTVNWFEGAATDKAYAIYHQDALWWAVASGTNAVTTNNKILRYDLLNGGWLIYDIPMNGMLVRNQSLYFGGVSTGTISKFGDVDNDNGSAINAYWKSKDFFGDSPFLDKTYVNMSVQATAIANSSMTVTYTIDASSSSAYFFALSKGVNGFTRNNRNLPLSALGNTLNVKYGNNAADQSFEVIVGQFGYRSKPWNTTP